MSDVHIVILAAGKGTRMKSALPKVLHTVAGQALIEHVLAAASRLSPVSVTVVVGHHSDTVRGALAARNHIQFVVQEPQLGTAHALLTTDRPDRRGVELPRVADHRADLARRSRHARDAIGRCAGPCGGVA